MTRRKLHNFYLDAELADGLKTVKERDGISEAEQVRRAIREWLQRKDVIEKAERKRATARQRS